MCRLNLGLFAAEAAFMSLMSTMLIFPNSFSVFKMILVSLIINVIFFSLIRKKTKIKSMYGLLFYLIFSFLALIWIFIGLSNGGASEAIYGYFKVYVIYSLIYTVLVIAIQDGRYMEVIFKSIHFSGLIIVIINAVLLLEVFLNYEFLPFWLKDEIVGAANLGDGYISVSANNINSLFFIAPVVYVSAASNNMSIRRSKIYSWILLLSIMIISVLSGRRALLLLLFVIPIVYFLQAYLFLNKVDVKHVSLSGSWVLFFSILPVLVVFAAMSLGLIDIGILLARFGENIDTGQARTDQYYSLLNGFRSNFWFGSGFGKSVEVIRDVDRPWLYELTYVQLLFNGGIIGFLAIFSLIFTFYIKALKNVSNFFSYKTEALSLLSGFVVFSIAAASNPYYSGFDTLFIIATLPVLAGWHAYSGRVNRQFSETS
jgi:hypothetical protein